MKLLDVFGILKVDQVPYSSFDQKVSAINGTCMGGGQWYEKVHFFLKLRKMLDRFSDDDASKGVAYKVYTLVGVVRVCNMLLDLVR